MLTLINSSHQTNEAASPHVHTSIMYVDFIASYLFAYYQMSTFRIISNDHSRSIHS